MTASEGDKMRKWMLCTALVLCLAQTVYADEAVVSDGPVQEQVVITEDISSGYEKMDIGETIPYIGDHIESSAPDAGVIWDVVDASGIVLKEQDSKDQGGTSVVVGEKGPDNNSSSEGALSPFGPGASGSSSSSSQGSGNAVVTTAKRIELINYAKQFLGNPYVYGGTSLTKGADCSGFTQAIFAKFGITTGRTSRDQYAKAQKISKAELKPGDLIFYASGSYINHVAIYCGNNIIIHAANKSTGIATGNAFYREPYGYGRFIND